MCLGLPGIILEIKENSAGTREARVSFSKTVQQVSLASLPEAKVGDYILVHYGFATERLEPETATEMIVLRRELDRFMAQEKFE